MAVNSNTWIDLFTKKFSDYSGYVLSLDDIVIVFKSTCCRHHFDLIKQTKGFGTTSMTRNLKVTF